jgi:large subunit ribosomal protein L30
MAETSKAKAAKGSSGAQIKVTQVGSIAGRTKDVKGAMSALGLGRRGQSRVFTPNLSLLGILEKVNHLITIEELK